MGRFGFTLRRCLHSLPEDNGTESEFETFELKIQEALGVPVVREDREVFVIQNPAADSAEKAKSWLDRVSKNNGP